MSKKATGIVSYITIVGWIIAFLAGDKEGAKFHLNQSLILVIANLILTIISNVINNGIISVILWLINVFFFVLWIIGLVHAIKEEEKPIPVLGGIQILK